MKKAWKFFAQTLLMVVVLGCEKENLPPKGELKADVVSGIEPLEVLFTFSGVDQDGTIAKFELDYEGDGIFEKSFNQAATDKFIFLKPGNFATKLRTTDDKGLSSMTQLSIVVNQNNPPTATLASSVDSGYPPLRVEFTPNASDSDGEVVKFEWDFNGDGTIDETTTKSEKKTHTFSLSGTYNSTVKVTDNKGKSTTAAKQIRILESKYVGFEGIEPKIGTYWKYRWVYDATVNGRNSPQESGFTTISLVDTVSVTFNTLGRLKLFKTRYVGTGNVYPLSWAGRPYIAFKDGTIFIAQIQSGQWSAAVLFNSRTGEFLGSQGFIGYFSSSRAETLTATPTINNPFNSTYSTAGVIVSEPFIKPTCETIAGVLICGTESHDYQVREYYFQKIGFGGFYRAGTSNFTGGGITTNIRSTMNVWLVETNL